MLYPLLFLAILTEESPRVVDKFGPLGGALVVVICGLRCIRGSYSNQSCQYLILIFSILFFKYDYKLYQESFLINFFVMSVIYHRVYELLLKVSFAVSVGCFH